MSDHIKVLKGLAYITSTAAQNPDLAVSDPGVILTHSEYHAYNLVQNVRY